jgi:hypothetical protein
MKYFLILLMLLSVGCATVEKPPKINYPILEEIEYSLDNRTEVWRREDGTRFIRFEINNKIKEMDIR